MPTNPISTFIRSLFQVFPTMGKKKREEKTQPSRNKHYRELNCVQNDDDELNTSTLVYLIM